MNIELLKPSNFIVIGLISMVFSMLVTIAKKQINSKTEDE